jgi:predicted nucleotidyltransferase
VRLFGSYARAEADENSDIDILVALVDPDRVARRTAHDLATDLSFDYGVVIAPVVVAEDTWCTYARQERPLTVVIAREGIAL